MLIVGAKGHAKEVLDVIQTENQSIYFFDNIHNYPVYKLYGKYKIIKSKEEVLKCFKQNNDFILGVGNPKIRFELSKLFESWGGKLTSVISESALISKYNVYLGKGLNIMHNVVIYNNVKIGEGTLINTTSTIHHDVTIGKFCEISPGAKILGGAKLGDFCTIGTGAIILPKVILGKNVIVGAGAMVNKNVADNFTVVGIPAKPLYERNKRN